MKKKSRNFLIFLLLYIIVDGCAVFDTNRLNPCNPQSPYKDSIECAKWKKDYPKEYNRYIKRTSKQPKNN